MATDPVIEPLKSLLSLYKQKDKVLRHYLPEKTVAKIAHHTYHGEEEEKEEKEGDDMLYLNDNAIFVSKGTGAVLGQGKILKIQGDHLTIRDKKDNLCLAITEHYVFIKRTKTTNKDRRRMFQEILQKLGD